MNIKQVLLFVCFAVSAVAVSAADEKHMVIVTASYKNAQWYAWNLDSVFDQKYENWHLIYVDDCSPL